MSISIADWMREQLKNYNGNVIEALSNEYENFRTLFPDSKSSRDTLRKNFHKIKKEFEENADILSENVRLAKNLQKQTDLNRIKNKGFREYARIENGIEEYSKQIVEVLKSQNLNQFTLKHESIDSKVGGAIQLSDLHLNELIDIPGNRYDFKIAAKRLKLLAEQAKSYFIPKGIKSLLLVMTGDNLNSNRRIDEFLNQATNRADATVLAFFLLKQFILDLNLSFNITIASVSGNESRINEEHGFTEVVGRDNFDQTIENFLRVSFMNCEGISFIDGSCREKVISFAGQNILILHGEGLKGSNTQKVIQQKVGGYSYKGIHIDYTIWGHLHSANISDYSARSSSMAGSNTYNEQALNLVGRASQNIYLFYTNGNRDAIKIDLQNTEHIEGYDIIPELEAYNAKSNQKANGNHKTVIEIII